jgi:hydroxyacylglutathione hydrolase
MKIHQLYTQNQLRNFTYVLEIGNSEAIVIDPWDAAEIISFLTEKRLSLTSIINTHEHWDHTQGNESLVKHYSCDVLAHVNGKNKIPGLSKTLIAGEKIPLQDGYQLVILDTPGHTFAHLCLLVQKDQEAQAVFTGDTLFNAGVGRCEGGDQEVLFETISRQFQVLDDSVVVYPGHDYLENNLNFTLKFEPDNQAAKNWLAKVQSDEYYPGSIQTTIGDEKSFNAFMRLDNSTIIANLELQKPDRKQVFVSLRAQRDNW